MNLTTDRLPHAVVVRVNEGRVMYPLLAEFAGAVSALFREGTARW